MAKNPNKEPGRIAQLWKIYKLTAAQDKKSVPIAIGGFVGTLAVFALAGLIFGGGNSVAIVAWSGTGVLASLLVALILMSRRAEVVAYAQIEGQAGAVGAVLNTALKRGWSGTETPVAISPKTRDMVYRVSGPGGIVLIGEGHRARVSTLVEAEKRKLTKVAQGVPVAVIWVCGDEHSTPLAKISRTLFKMKKVLNRSEMSAVNKRLQTMSLSLPIPKGIDPTRVRASRG